MIIKGSGNKRKNGISVNSFAYPILIFVAIMHIILVAMIIDVNTSSNKLSESMERFNTYQLDVTNIQKTNTTMSETCNTFVSKPFNDDSLITGPLMAYINALNSEDYATHVAERFRTYDVSAEVRGFVEEAAKLSEEMTKIQIHALSLIDSVSEFPSPIRTSITLNNLSQQELDMTEADRLNLAKSMLLEQEYVRHRYHISEYTESCNLAIQKDFSNAANHSKEHVTTLRYLIWLVIIIIISVLVATFIFFYLSIIKPLRTYSEDIAANRSILRYGRIAEMRHLVNSYNGLLKGRNKLEDILRSAAENDALTGLPNRYCFERDMMKHEEAEVSMALLLFDVNYLKRTNDTQGHLAGDQLLKASAECIKECFSAGNSNNCYRIGGDEFVALITDCDEANIKKRIDRFNHALQRENITVSVGYSFADGTTGINFKEMMNEADDKMYEQKKLVHEAN